MRGIFVANECDYDLCFSKYCWSMFQQSTMKSAIQITTLGDLYFSIILVSIFKQLQQNPLLYSTLVINVAATPSVV